MRSFMSFSLLSLIPLLLESSDAFQIGTVSFQQQKLHQERQQTALSVSSLDYLSSLSSPVPRQQQPQVDYLSSLSSMTWEPTRSAYEAVPAEVLTPPSPPPVQQQPQAESVASSSVAGQQGDEVVKFSHAPLSYFAIPKLTPKGPRSGADVGAPHDATRPLTKVVTGLTSTNSLSSGSWWCAEGGWPSPNLRATTEIFYVFDGHGCVTDTDGTPHYFGPGDTVILPKGWSGRWDIMEAIHKVWFVHDHPEIEEDTTKTIRAIIAPYNQLVPSHQQSSPQLRTDALFGTTPYTSYRTIYDLGPTKVGSWTATPGSFPYKGQSCTVGFHILEGVGFLTNAGDGTAQKCVAGDTVVLPRGWTGQCDVIETIKKLQVVVE